MLPIAASIKDHKIDQFTFNVRTIIVWVFGLIKLHIWNNGKFAKGCKRVRTRDIYTHTSIRQQWQPLFGIVVWRGSHSTHKHGGAGKPDDETSGLAHVHTFLKTLVSHLVM